MDINILQFPELLRRSVLVNAFIDARRESESCSKSVLHLDIAKFFKRVSDVPIFDSRYLIPDIWSHFFFQIFDSRYLIPDIWIRIFESIFDSRYLNPCIWSLKCKSSNIWTMTKYLEPNIWNQISGFKYADSNIRIQIWVHLKPFWKIWLYPNAGRSSSSFRFLSSRQI